MSVWTSKAGWCILKNLAQMFGLLALNNLYLARGKLRAKSALNTRNWENSAGIATSKGHVIPYAKRLCFIE